VNMSLRNFEIPFAISYIETLVKGVDPKDYVSYTFF